MAVVWITGGKGFIGRHLASYANSAGAEVYGVGHGSWVESDASTWGYQQWLNAEIDFASLNHLVELARPDYIFHLAGGSAVGPSLANPYEDFQRTVDTTARLLEWVRQTSPESRVIGVSSAAVYGSGFDTAISEEQIGQPFSPYGFHKFMAEKLFESYQESFDLDVSIARLFSVYGPGLKKQLLWDLCVKLQHAENDVIKLNGTGNEVRDWIHVNDAVRLLWGMAENGDNCPFVLNGGAGSLITIREVAEKVSDLWGRRCRMEFSGISRKGDPHSLLANTIKAEAFSFEPTINLDEGLQQVVSWYRETYL